MDNVSPWNPENINTDFCMLRHIPANKRITDRIHKFPGPDHFALREDINEKALSFNWGKYADAKTVYIILGLTIGELSGKPIDYSGYILYQYPVEFLSTLPKFKRLEHDPIWNGNPSPLGKPNNKAHSLLFCGNFDNGTRALLSLYCNENETSLLSLKIKTIREEVEALKERAPNVPYHKDWIFEGY